MPLSSKTALTLAVLASLGVAASHPAAAQTSISIFATGVDSTGATLANGTMGDPHYSIFSHPANATSQLEVLTSAYGFPIVPNAWIGDSSTSTWIAPANTPFLNGGNGGFYDYQTTFTLAGFDPATSTAAITGSWAADDTGTNILINGAATGNATAHGYGAYTPFSITSGFKPGLNTLDFIVLEDGSGATGIRVDGITGTTNPVPEASTTVSFGLLLALGLGGALIAQRKSVKA